MGRTVTEIRLKRAYDAPSPDDGVRVLVDRLWPRGLKRDAAKVELWLKDVAPSAELRRWFGHDPARWPEFQQRYRVELGQNVAAVNKLRELARGGKTVTLLFAAKDPQHNNAVVLRDFLSSA
jgi:uncharacterized protein YeaO (DUF488 family)